jgi:hypothetical protein
MIDILPDLLAQFELALKKKLLPGRKERDIVDGMELHPPAQSGFLSRPK